MDPEVEDQRGLRSVVGAKFAQLLEVAGRGTGVCDGIYSQPGAFSARAASIPLRMPGQRGEAGDAP